MTDAHDHRAAGRVSRADPPDGQVAGGAATDALGAGAPLVDVLRTALESLAAGAATREAGLAAAAQAFERRIAWVRTRHDVTLDRAQQQQQRRARLAKREHKALMARLDRDHDQQREKIGAKFKVQQEQIGVESRDIEIKAVESHEHERWVAGSVFEGTVVKIKQWHKDRQRELDAATLRFDAATHRAQLDLEAFRVPELALRLVAESQPLNVARSNNPPSDDPDSPDDQPVPTDAESSPSFTESPHGAPRSSKATRSAGPLPPQLDTAHPWAWFEDAERRFLKHSRRLARAPLPSIFVGVWPWLIASGVVIAGGLAGLLLPEEVGGTAVPPPVAILFAGVVTLLLLIPLGWLVFRVARGQVARAVEDSATLHAEATEALRAYHQWSQQEYDRRIADARAVRDAALHEADGKYRPVIEEIRHRRKHLLARLEAKVNDRTDAMAKRFATEYGQAEQANRDAEQARAQRIARRGEITAQRRDRDLAAAERDRQQRVRDAENRWAAQRDTAIATVAAVTERAARDAPDWPADGWDRWTPPRQPAALAQFGHLRFDPTRLLDSATAEQAARLGLPASLDMPAALSTPGPRSWMIEAGPDDREAALSTMRSLVLRLLTTQPPGRVRLTLLDPVGLGESFAALMHLADHDEQLVTSRAWSEPAQMERRLLDLTDHMSLVIQKYLRNDFETIEAYNAQAGELAEPYRFLVMADFPHGLSDEALARLSSIASAGARCGVFVLLLRDPRKDLSRSVVEDLRRHCVTVSRQRTSGASEASGDWRIGDGVFGRFDLTLDDAPDESRFTTLLQRIGEGAVDAERVQVPFTSITPAAGQHWTGDTAEELSVYIGRAGATRLQRFTLGHGVEQHALVAGKTGSGKSSLLHAMVTNLALWYPPDQLELYLIDFKKGVEFKPYVTHQLPHARAIAIESDRGFGLSILRELDRMMDERGERFRAAGVQSLPQFRKSKPDERMPRVLLVVDEFQELFSRDDQVAQDAAMLLDRLVRQGRAFGVHAMLGSQSLSGAAGLARGTMGQMAVRIALQCNEADSQLILSDENTAARLLSRPGEAIYNHRGGDVEGNAVFQVAWLPDEQMVASLREVDELRRQRGVAPLPRAVFEGNAPALLTENAELAAMLQGRGPDAPPAEPRAFVGEPIAIESATALRLARQPGAHALIVGGTAETALPLLVSSALSLSAQHPIDAARFVALNGSSEPAHDETLRALAEALPHVFTVVSPRDAAAELADLHTEMKRRLDADDRDAATVYLMFFGLQRFRELRKAEDSFSFSLDDEDGPKATPPDKALGELLRDGPAQGVHVIVWADRAATVDGAFDRRDLREFDSRVLFQMSANDSAQLIDSTEANDLGGFRALLHREDRGTFTRFRPYGPVDPVWLHRAGERLRDRTPTTSPHHRSG